MQKNVLEGSNQRSSDNFTHVDLFVELILLIICAMVYKVSLYYNFQSRHKLKKKYSDCTSENVILGLIKI